MAFEEFIPKQRYKGPEFLHMLKRLFPRGPMWNFKVSRCVGVDTIEEVALPATPLGGGTIQYMRTLNGKIWIGVTGSPAKLYSWDGISTHYTLEADTNFGQVDIYGLEYYDNKIFVGCGTNGVLLQHVPGSGVFTLAAPQLLGQSGLYFLEVWNDILYAGTWNGGRLFKYDKASPGAMSQVLPQAYGENAVHFLHEFAGKLYGGTGSDANLFEWDGVGSVWVQRAIQPGTALEVYALEVYNGELYGGSAFNSGFYKWNGTDAWIPIPLPAEIPTNLSVHFLKEHNGALIGATDTTPYLFKYLNGVVTVVARPSDFASPSSGVLGMAVINNNLYAGQGVGGIYKVNISSDDGRSSMLAILMSCFSTECERFAADFNKLLRESVPGLSTEAELLTDWERIAGLPDECSPLASTESQRQQVVHNKIYTQYSGLTKQFFIDYAAGLNVTITIEDDPGGSVFRTTHKTGSAIQRVTRMPGSGTPTERIDGSRLNSAQTLFTFAVTVTADPDGNQDVLECIFEKLKPANTQMVFIPI